MVFQKLNIKPRALKSLIGALILKFATSVTSCWGNINLYFLSQFYNQGFVVTPKTNSLILCISVVPMVISLIVATRLCNRFGYELVIRICCLLFFLAPLTSIFVFTPFTFVLFSIVIPGSAFALSSIPILNCMWTQFPQSKNKVTALLVIAFGLGGIVWNLLFMHMINPNNEPAIHKHDNINFFTPQVTQHVRKTSIIGFAITGLLAIIGSLLLQRKPEEESKLSEQPQIQQNQKNQQKSDHRLTKSSEANMTLKEALMDEKFILIMMVSFLTGLYEIHLMMNFKIIYMPVVTDDHFLSYSIMLCSLVSIVGAFFWGCLGDIKGVAFTILILSILDFGSKLFSDFALSKPTIIIMVILVGLISKSMTTLAGPGFVQYFGLKMGTELLPFKGISILLGYVLVPLFQLLTSNYLSPHQYLVVISFASIITLGCAIRLYTLTNTLKTCEQDDPKDIQYQITPQKQLAGTDNIILPSN